MHTLDHLLASVLHRAPTNAWVVAEDFAALAGANALTARSAIVVGRLLRAADCVRGEREALDEWLLAFARSSTTALDPVIQATYGDLDRLAEALSAERLAASALLLRDEVESRISVLGHIALLGRVDDAVVAHERRLLDRIASVDVIAIERMRETTADVASIANAWLSRAAALDVSSWWLDPVAIHELRRRAETFRWPRTGSIRGRPPIRFRRRRVDAVGPGTRAVAEVVGCEDDFAHLVPTHGTLVARLFEGEVEIFAIGLGITEGIESGLCVRRPGGGDDGIETVQAPSAAIPPSRRPSGWWVPLAGIASAVEIVVRLQESGEAREERLVIVPETH
jgi:hypothetical protein